MNGTNFGQIWIDEVVNLFGEKVPNSTPGKKKSNQTAINLHKKLIALHGASEGNKCKGCKYFITRHFGKKYFKCELSGKTSGSPSSDWRANWQACGKFSGGL